MKARHIKRRADRLRARRLRLARKAIASFRQLFANVERLELVFDGAVVQFGPGLLYIDPRKP